MRRRSLSARVVTLSSVPRSRSVPDPPPMWLLTLIAVELGDLQEHEAVATGYGCELGYEEVQSFRAGLASGEVGERHRDALMRITSRRRIPAAHHASDPICSTCRVIGVSGVLQRAIADGRVRALRLRRLDHGARGARRARTAIPSSSPASRPWAAKLVREAIGSVSFPAFAEIWRAHRRRSQQAHRREKSTCKAHASLLSSSAPKRSDWDHARTVRSVQVPEPRRAVFPTWWDAGSRVLWLSATDRVGDAARGRRNHRAAAGDDYGGATHTPVGRTALESGEATALQGHEESRWVSVDTHRQPGRAASSDAVAHRVDATAPLHTKSARSTAQTEPSCATPGATSSTLRIYHLARRSFSRRAGHDKEWDHGRVIDMPHSVRLGMLTPSSNTSVPQALAACHTAEVDGYVIEGHVPAPAIKRLLSERPQAKGLAVEVGRSAGQGWRSKASA